jgi:hypothetical protein
MMVARTRHDDLLREAERHRLAAAAAGRERLSLRERIAAFLHGREARRREAPRVAPSVK